MDAGIIRSVPTDILSGVIEGIPQKRLGPSTEICSLAEYLLSENASYITGETLGINGGL
jgi:3-oxoacyl-[acyl-carrier protein] reductase